MIDMQHSDYIILWSTKSDQVRLQGFDMDYGRDNLTISIVIDRNEVIELVFPKFLSYYVMHKSPATIGIDCHLKKMEQNTIADYHLNYTMSKDMLIDDNILDCRLYELSLPDDDIWIVTDVDALSPYRYESGEITELGAE